MCAHRHSELDSLNTAVRQYNPRFFESVVIWGAGRHYRGDVGPPRSNHRSHPGTGEFKSSTDWPPIPRLTVVLGVNSMEIMNFGHETVHETRPSSGPNSILGHY